MNDAVDSIGKLAHALTEAPITDIVAGVGGEPVHSRWIAIDQAMIDRFATLTNDHNWLHVDPERAAKSPVGSTIAHGFLTLSLIPTMAYEVLPRVQESTMGMNYGLNKVRFVAPVRVGSRVRGASFVRRSWMRSIASLQMSAALPWIGVFCATRSPKPRSIGLLLLSSGMMRLRPSSVSA